MWFTEDPWPPVMVLGVVAVVFGIAWHATRRGMYFLAAAGSVLLMLVVLIAEEMIVTDAEQVEARVLALTDDVVKGDIEKVLSYISDDAGGLKSDVESRLEHVKIDEGLRITDLAVTMQPGGLQAKSHFRANGAGSYKSLSHNFATRWNLTWQKEAGTWKLIKIEQLEPINGDVLDTWPGI